MINERLESEVQEHRSQAKTNGDVPPSGKRQRLPIVRLPAPKLHEQRLTQAGPSAAKT